MCGSRKPAPCTTLALGFQHMARPATRQHGDDQPIARLKPIDDRPQIALHRAKP
jgi:hypothetical protein